MASGEHQAKNGPLHSGEFNQLTYYAEILGETVYAMVPADAEARAINVILHRPDEPDDRAYSFVIVLHHADGSWEFSPQHFFLSRTQAMLELSAATARDA